MILNVLAKYQGERHLFVDEEVNPHNILRGL